jgi:hypothetical protein
LDLQTILPDSKTAPKENVGPRMTLMVVVVAESSLDGKVAASRRVHFAV